MFNNKNQINLKKTYILSNMQCELCGKYMEVGSKIRVIGAVMTVCEGCSKHGKVIEVIRKKPPPVDKVKQEKKEKAFVREAKVDEPEESIIEDFSLIIKKTREHLNMKQEDFAKNINEPLSMVKRIETGFEPTLGVAMKIEDVLKIKLIRKMDKFEIPKIDKSGEKLTLGDVVKIKSRQK